MTGSTLLNKISITKIQIANFFGCMLIGILVIIGTFPENEWTFSCGIDAPLIWVFNYLFENNPGLGKHIIFPHGPLAFLMYPTPDNILLTVLLLSVLKFILVFSTANLLSNEKKFIQWIVTALVAYGFSIIGNVNTLILINIILLYCNYFISKKNGVKYIAFFLTSLSLYIKAYVAIVSGIFFFSFIAYWFYTEKNIKQLLIDCSCLLGSMLLLWMLMYGSVTGLPEYVWGMIQLAQDNSSAASYYPYNNWWVLTLFFLLFAGVFWINRTKKTAYYLCIILLGLFATWKHGMAREEIFHVQGLFIYIILCLLVFILFQKKKIYLSIGLSIAAVYAFSVNKKNSIGYVPINYDICRAGNFIDFITDFQELKDKSEASSLQNIAVNKLPDKVRTKISTATADAYPWDYSIIKANNLNWQPRIVIQSYAAYTPWLDAQNAHHFNSNQGADYLIWELKKLSTDVNEGDMNSIDRRYLPNDEPQTILELIKGYDYFYSDKKFLVVKKRAKPLSVVKHIIGQSLSTWGQWINVPPIQENLVRAKLHFDNTWFQRMKSFLYKDEQFWIYLQLKSGVIHKYRIVPKNAVDGLWINPYIFDTKTAYVVEKVMFKCSMQRFLTDKLTIAWEETKFEGAPYRARDFFNIPNLTTDSILFQSLNGYEEKPVKGWTEAKDKEISDNAFSGTKSHFVKAQSYSSTFAMSLDSINFQHLKIQADCWIKSPRYTFSNLISLVISIEDATGGIIWKSIPADEQLIDEKQWNNIYSTVDYKHVIKGRTMKVYVFNASEEDIFVDDFRILIQKAIDRPVD